MLKAAGEVADGTVTWMVGRNTIAERTAPAIARAAQRRRARSTSSDRRLAGVRSRRQGPGHGPAPCRFSQGYGQLPNYRRQLDAEGLNQAGEIAVVGNEDDVTQQLQAYFDAGATEVIASVYPAGDNSRGSFARTTALLQQLAA